MTVNQPPENTQPIDAVITWVDGNDQGYHEKMKPFFSGQKRGNIPGAHLTRFASVNEIKYCILSILTFAPFVRKVFIVTDGQDPKVFEDIKTFFPERLDSIKIVDHSEIFRGFEAYLPTFSSRSIEGMMWRIKGLSDNFIYFNDDTFLIRKIKPEDWFISKRPVLRGRWISSPKLRIYWNVLRKTFHKYLLNNPDYLPRPSFHLGQSLAASVLGLKGRYFYFYHTPHAISRKKIANFFEEKKEIFEKNISFRFRSHDQINFVSLAYHLELITGNAKILKPDLAYVQPLNRSRNYIDKKIRFCESHPEIKYLCVQSLELCRKEDQEKIFSWLEGILGMKQ